MVVTAARRMAVVLIEQTVCHALRSRFLLETPGVPVVDASLSLVMRTSVDEQRRAPRHGHYGSADRPRPERGSPHDRRDGLSPGGRWPTAQVAGALVSKDYWRVWKRRDSGHQWAGPGKTARACSSTPLSAPLAGWLSGWPRSDTWTGRPRCEAWDQLLNGVRQTCYNHDSVMRKEAR